MEMLLIMAVFIGLMYVLMVLPQKKKMDAQKKMLSALQPGSRVMLTSGVFGTIRALGDQQMVVELAPGVEVTVLRAAVARTVSANEEEFEYSDELEPVASREALVGSAEPQQAESIHDDSEPAAGPDFEPGQPVVEALEVPAGQDARTLTDDDRSQGR